MEWQEHLSRLLDGTHAPGDPLEHGAQLVVTDPDGSEVFRSALARCFRVEQDDPTLVWIRPVLRGAIDPETGWYVFNLNLVRRRCLHWTTVTDGPGGGLVFGLVSGQVARVEPARGDELAELRRWDDFTLTVLTAEEERALEALEEDSWIGRFS